MSALIDLRAIVIHPTQPERLYVAGQGGIFRSDNAGESWQQAAGVADLPMTALAMHPTNHDRLYAAAKDGRLFRTDDGGASWQGIVGAP